MISYIAFLLIAASPMAIDGNMTDSSSRIIASEMSQLIEVMKLENQKRDVAIRNGQGYAKIIITASIDADSHAGSTKEMSFKKRPSTCANVMEVSWYTRGDYIRYDRSIIKHLDDTGNPYAQCDPEGHLIVATGPSSSIYYNRSEQRAYLNAPPIEVYNYTGLLYAFNVRRLYDIERGKENAEILRSYDEDAVRIVDEDVGGIRCAHIIYRPDKKLLSKNSYRQYMSDVFISLEQGFSIVRWNSAWLSFLDDQIVHQATEEYEAEYYKDPLHEDVWLIRRMHRRDNCVKEQEMWAECMNQIVNIDVSWEMFNFDGMGVPRGTPIFDKRENGSTEVIKYGDGMYVGLDTIYLDDGKGETADLADHSTSDANNEVDNGGNASRVNPSLDASKSYIALWVALILLALAVICVFLRKAFAKRCSK